MATQDVRAVKVLRRELAHQLSEQAMGFVWTNPGGLDNLMRVHGDEFNIEGAEQFLQRRKLCAEHVLEVLAEKLEQLGNPEDDRQVFLGVREEEWKSDQGHLPNRARFVLNFLDEQQKRGRNSMRGALIELIEVLNVMSEHFARIRDGSAANQPPTHLETTGPPEPRVIRLSRPGQPPLQSATC